MVAEIALADRCCTSRHKADVQVIDRVPTNVIIKRKCHVDEENDNYITCSRPSERLHVFSR